MAAPMPIEPITPAVGQAIDVAEEPKIRERVWGLEARGDSSVTFAEYTYWAKIERQLEMESERQRRETQGPWSFKQMIGNRFSKGVGRSEPEAITAGPTNAVDEKHALEVTDNNSSRSAVSDEEWRTAARALKTASWGTIFFLITTDILGWSNAPFVFASVGYGTGVAVYFIFGAAAAVAGFFLWTSFIHLDSARFPILSYGDLFLRLYGPKARHFINVTQSFQQFCSVMVVLFGNAQILSQLAGPNFCFIACLIISMVIGIFLGGIRSLQRLGWLCNFSVWLNIVSFIIIMVAANKYPIDYNPVFGSTVLPKVPLPVKTFAGPVPNAYQQQTSSSAFAAIFNGINQMVYAYSGALIFVAFMAEMRHPMDFWKGMMCAQAFICFVYILFGAYVYSNFGQYSISNIYQAIQPQRLQTATNVLSLLTGCFALVLYFNIGMKTVYIEVFQEILHFPPIVTKRGRWMWFALGPVYWVLAWVVATAVPNLNGIVSFIGGLLSLNFTYSFPGVAFLGLMIHQGAEAEGEGFDPSTGVTSYHDTGLTRWRRGFLKRWYVTVPTLIFILASLACSGMGTWAAIEGLISIFGPGGTVATSFGCASPVWS